DLGGMPLLAVLAFPVAKGQLAEDTDRLALLQPLLGRLRRLAEAQALIPVGHLVVVLAPVAHQLHFCESHLVSSFCAGWRALLRLRAASPEWPATVDRDHVRRSDSCGGTDVPLHD